MVCVRATKMWQAGTEHCYIGPKDISHWEDFSRGDKKHLTCCSTDTKLNSIPGILIDHLKRKANREKFRMKDPESQEDKSEVKGEK